MLSSIYSYPFANALRHRMRMLLFSRFPAVLLTRDVTMGASVVFLALTGMACGMTECLISLLMLDDHLRSCCCRMHRILESSEAPLGSEL